MPVPAGSEILNKRYKDSEAQSPAEKAAEDIGERNCRAEGNKAVRDLPYKGIEHQDKDCVVQPAAPRSKQGTEVIAAHRAVRYRAYDAVEAMPGEILKERDFAEIQEIAYRH